MSDSATSIDFKAENLALRSRLALVEQHVLSAASRRDSGVWHWPNVEEDLIYVSGDLRELLGLDLNMEVVPLLTIFQDVIKADIPRLQHELQEILIIGGILNTCYRVKIDDVIYEANTIGEVTFHEDKPASMVGSISVFERTNDHKDRYPRLFAKEALYGLLEKASVYLWEWPKIGESALTVSGNLIAFKKSDHAADAWNSLISPAELASFQTTIDSLIIKPGKFALEMRVRFNKDGYRWHLCRGTVSTTFGGHLKGVGTLTDIHDRKLLDEEHANTSARLELVIKGAKAGTYDWPDMAEKFVLLSDELISLLGYETREPAMANIDWLWALVHPKDMPIVEAELARCSADGGLFNLQYRYLHQSEGWRYYRTTGSTSIAPDADGRRRLTGSVVDIHDKILAEQKLAEANEQLLRFTYLVAHDLSAPIRQIGGYAKLLLEDYAELLDRDGKTFITTIVSASDNAQHMIKDLLDYASTGTSTLNLEAIDLTEIVGQIRDLLNDTGKQVNVTWQVDKLPIVKADRSQMHMLFQNLLSNAVKFSAKRENPVVTISNCYPDRDQCCITITDNGIGFDAEHASQIFEPFYRAHQRDAFLGMGIGLTNVKRIIDLHGGNISASSSPDAGASFEVVLPLYEPVEMPTPA